MSITQSRAKRKSTGGRYIAYRKKKLYEIGKTPSLTKLDEVNVKKDKTKGGSYKFKILSSNIANVVDPKTHKYSKAKIITVAEVPANRHYMRRNIMVKGAIIKTDKGKARITSRPGQDGVINAVLIE